MSGAGAARTPTLRAYRWTGCWGGLPTWFVRLPAPAVPVDGTIAVGSPNVPTSPLSVDLSVLLDLSADLSADVLELADELFDVLPAAGVAELSDESRGLPDV